MQTRGQLSSTRSALQAAQSTLPPIPHDDRAAASRHRPGHLTRRPCLHHLVSCRWDTEDSSRLRPGFDRDCSPEDRYLDTSSVGRFLHVPPAAAHASGPELEQDPAAIINRIATAIFIAAPSSAVPLVIEDVRRFVTHMRWKGRICGHPPEFREPALSLIRREIAVQNPTDHPERVRNRRSSNGLEKRFLVAAEGFERMDNWPRGSEVGVRMPLHELKDLGERPFSRGDVSEIIHHLADCLTKRSGVGVEFSKSVRYRVPHGHRLCLPNDTAVQRRAGEGARGAPTRPAG